MQHGRSQQSKMHSEMSWHDINDTSCVHDKHLELKLRGLKCLPAWHDAGNGSIVNQLLLQQWAPLDLHNITCIGSAVILLDNRDVAYVM